MFRYLPEQASSIAADVDWIHNLITDLSVFFTVAIVGAMIYFAYKYRKRDGVDHETPSIEGSHRLEVVWTVVPTIICIIVGYYGIIYYHDMRTVPENAMTIKVIGQKWKWDFEYENGKTTNNEFVVPVDKPVRLWLQSRDVLHSFFIPSMRVKSDAVPGQYTYLVFTPIKTGTYKSYCTEYCGDKHYDMLATLKVVSQDEYDTWINDKSDEIKAKWITPAERGAGIYTAKGCNSCHSLDGSRVVGPTFLKLFGSEREFEDGTKRIADEEYLRQSVYQPYSQVVKGYPAKGMQQYVPSKEVDPLSTIITEDELSDLVAFIKTLDGSKPIAVEEEPEEAEVDFSKMTPEEHGEWLYQNKLCVTCHSLDGNRIVGPSFKGIYNKEGELQDGTKYVADDEYLSESIVEPNNKIVKDYAPAMPKQQFADDEVKALVEYMKTIK